MSNYDISLQDVLEAVNKGFQSMEDRMEVRFGGLEQLVVDLRSEMNGRFDQVWHGIGNWPAPSTTHDLMSRMSYVERKLKIKPGEFRNA